MRLFLINGIDRLSLALGFTGKTRGQLIGFATSIPELVVVVSASLTGVFQADFQNIHLQILLTVFFLRLP
ncbi:MAG: hypothetical protein ACLFQK_03155 [Fibrobacterota bacterium]